MGCCPIRIVSPCQRTDWPGPMKAEGDISFIYNTNHEIGNHMNIMYSKGLAYVPSEFDMSIRQGWFWHEEPWPIERMFSTYVTSVGANAGFSLNIPPNKKGLIDNKDVERLKEYGDLLKRIWNANKN